MLVVEARQVLEAGEPVVVAIPEMLGIDSLRPVPINSETFLVYPLTADSMDSDLLVARVVLRAVSACGPVRGPADLEQAPAEWEVRTVVLVCDREQELADRALVLVELVARQVVSACGREPGPAASTA